MKEVNLKEILHGENYSLYLFQKRKTAPISDIFGVAKYGNAWDIQNLRYIMNKLVVSDVE